MLRIALQPWAADNEGFADDEEAFTPATLRTAAMIHRLYIAAVWTCSWA